MNLNEMRDRAFAQAQKSGFHTPDDGTARQFPEEIALVHSELSEALEDYRKGLKPGEFRYSMTGVPTGSLGEVRNDGQGWYVERVSTRPSACGDPTHCLPTKEIHYLTDEDWQAAGYAKKPEGIPSELADVLIRIGDIAGKYGIDLEKAVEEKMAYNATRPFKHGKIC